MAMMDSIRLRSFGSFTGMGVQPNNFIERLPAPNFASHMDLINMSLRHIHLYMIYVKFPGQTVDGKIGHWAPHD
jgi:hypothetical protein